MRDVISPPLGPLSRAEPKSKPADGPSVPGLGPDPEPEPAFALLQWLLIDGDPRAIAHGLAHIDFGPGSSDHGFGSAFSPLLVLAQHDNVRAASQLLAASQADPSLRRRLNLDPLARDPITGWTPLHLAAEWNSRAMLALLPQFDPTVDLDARGFDHETPLHVAISYGRSATTVQWLVQHGASVEARDALGDTPLHVAAREGQSEAISILVEAGANVHARNAAGNTPLHEAAYLDELTVHYMAEAKTQVGVVRLLLQHGAIMETCNHQGQTVLDKARADGGSEMMLDVLRQGRKKQRRREE